MFPLFASSALSYFPFYEPVIQGTQDNWADVVTDYTSTGVCVLFFLKKKNPPSKAIFNDFQTAANKSSSIVKYVSVDIVEEPKIAFQYYVRKVPTIIIIHPRGQMEYKGDTTADAIMSAANGFILNYAKPVTSAWLPSPKTPKSAILLSTSRKAPSFWAELSTDYVYNDTVQIGFSSSQEIMSAFSVSGKSNIIFVSGEFSYVYEGQHTHSAIKAAMEEFFANPHSSGKSADLVGVIETKAEFESLCRNTGKFCVVNSGEDEESFNETARSNKGSPFRFLRCGERCPLDGMGRGVWVFHPKRASAIRVAAGELDGVLDHIVDGSARYTPLSTLLAGNDL